MGNMSNDTVATSVSSPSVSSPSMNSPSISSPSVSNTKASGKNILDDVLGRVGLSANGDDGTA